MDRRRFVIGTFAAVTTPFNAFAQVRSVNVDERVAEMEAKVVRRRELGKPIPASWIVSGLEDGLTMRERRIAAFRLVQDYFYKLTAWKGDPDSLFSLGRGDCRHKSAALLRLLRAWRIEARPVQIPFDWADLPIPAYVLEPLLETRGIHDSVEAKIDGRFVLVDPTWDPALGKVGFPILTSWDGTGPTLPITEKANVIVRPGDLTPGTDIFAHFGIKWPERDRIVAFNRALNVWTDEVRARFRLGG